MRKLTLILSTIILLSCNNKSTPVESSMLDLDETVVSVENVNELLIKSSPYTRESQDFFGVEALVFEGNKVRFSVASLYALGQIVDREDITGAYTASSNGNIITVELNFNTNFVFLDYLIDGSSTGGKTIKEVNVPYILKGSKTKDGHITIDSWENSKQKEDRLKREEIEANKEEVIEDYGIDKDIILGQYKSSDEKKDVSVNITSINELEVTKIRKKGIITGILKVKGMEKEFTSDYETGYDGNKYTFSVDYKDDRGRNSGVLLVFENILNANFYSDSGSSKRFELERVENIEEIETIQKGEQTISNIQYYRINDPDHFSNLREEPNGKIIRKIFEDEKFEVLKTISNYKMVKMSDGTVGFIHQSRVVKIEK